MNDGDTNEFEIPDGIEKQIKEVLGDVSEHEQEQISEDQKQKHQIEVLIFSNSITYIH